MHPGVAAAIEAKRGASVVVGGREELACYDLGAVSWWASQCLYHALAELGREGLIICHPREPYVCLGLHDDLEEEVDVDYCRREGIPLIRRETGGGVVYLDDAQVFYQLVLRRDNPIMPAARSRFFERFLRPAIAVHRRFGVPARLRAPADLVVDDRKCSGNAAGDIGGSVAFVGNILLDFDVARMCRVLRVPDDAFRSRLETAMTVHMCTANDWSQSPVDRASLISALVEEFAREFGALTPTLPDAHLLQTAAVLRCRLTAREWLAAPGRRAPHRKVKVAEGVYVE